MRVNEAALAWAKPRACVSVSSFVYVFGALASRAGQCYISFLSQFRSSSLIRSYVRKLVLRQLRSRGDGGVRCSSRL